MKKINIILLLFIINISAWADSDDPNCTDLKQATQHDLDFCANQQYKISDNVLNKNYQVIMRSLPTYLRIKLKKQQRAWIKWRDNYCKNDYPYESSEEGSMHGMEYLNCLSNETELRNNKLMAWNANQSDKVRKKEKK